MKEIDPTIKAGEKNRERHNKLRREIEGLKMYDLAGVPIGEFVALLRVMGMGRSPLDRPNTRDLEIVEKRIGKIVASRLERIKGK